MPLTIATTSSVGAGPRFTYAAAGDSYYITRGTVIGSTSGGALGGLTYDNLSLTVAGELISAAGLAFGGVGANFTIMRGASVSTHVASGTSSGLFFNAPNAVFTNYGSVSALQSVGVLARDSNQSLVNYGDISGASPVFVFISANTSLLNAGSIAATNYGEVEGVRYNNGVFVEYSRDVLIRNFEGGSISANSAMGAGVRFSLETGGGLLMNSGVIESRWDYGVSLWGVDSGSSMIRVYNWGTISGYDGSYAGSVNSDLLVNRGMMQGHIYMADGADTFDNRGGRVDGDVHMGEGDDVYNGMLNTIVNGAVYGGNGNDTLFGGSNMDVIYGDDGNDRIVGFEGDDSLYGGAGNDNIAGREGQDLVDGGAGNDNISGGYGDDSVFGGAGSDTIQGNEGNDRLVGGAGGDFLYGGAGQDVFVFNGVSDSPFAVVADRDRIMDFVRGEDMIELTQIDANTTLAGDQAFTFIGAAAFSSVAGQLRYDAATGLVSGDVNGDGVADIAFAIITRPAVLSAADFFL